MDYNIDELVFTKTNKTGPDQFYWFIKTSLTWFIFFENLKKKYEKSSDKPENRSIYHFHSNFEF
jgi:hypothetical protein